MSTNVVVLGGGVGGTLVANLLSKTRKKDAKVTVFDRTGMHVYQPGFLYVALDQANALWLARDERTLLRKDVDLVIDEATKIDPEKRVVSLAHDGELRYDHLVVTTDRGLRDHLSTVYASVPGW